MRDSWWSEMSDICFGEISGFSVKEWTELTKKIKMQHCFLGCKLQIYGFQSEIIMLEKFMPTEVTYQNGNSCFRYYNVRKNDCWNIIRQYLQSITWDSSFLAWHLTFFHRFYYPLENLKCIYYCTINTEDWCHLQLNVTGKIRKRIYEIRMAKC